MSTPRNNPFYTPQGEFVEDLQDLVISARIPSRAYATLVRFLSSQGVRIKHKGDPVKLAVNQFLQMALDRGIVDEVETEEEARTVLREYDLMPKEGTRNHEILMKNAAREEFMIGKREGDAYNQRKNRGPRKSPGKSQGRRFSPEDLK